MVYLTENMYGPRLEVMTSQQLHSKEAKLNERYTRFDVPRTEAIATKLGVQLRPMLASDPSAQLHYYPSSNLQYDFRAELVKALNHGLASVGCRTHSVRLSDHTDDYMKLHNQYWSEDFYGDKDELYKKMKFMEDPNATLVWKKKDAFSADTPSSAVYEALNEFFADATGHPVISHVQLGDTIEVKPLDASKWVPMEQTEVERIFMKAKAELSDPKHPWVAARGIDTDGKPVDPQLYAYIASQFEPPLVRNGQLLYDGLRFNHSSPTNVGYLVVGRESCGTTGIQNDAEGLLQRASAGKFSQVQLNYSHLPDVLISAAYHAQSVAHQKERAAWNQAHPVKHAPGEGPVMTKPVADLQVGDYLGAASQEKGVPDLWCKVTKREGDVVTLFIENGHWDFQLDTSTNQSLPHDIVKDFAGKAQVVYTAPIPVKDGALYNQALEYMREHVARMTTPELVPSA
jgi:hypothetical protein